MYKIATVCVSGVTAVPIDLKPIPRGITGAVVEFLFDDDIWAGLRKKVAFRGSGEVEILCDGDTVIFPTEVAQRAKTWVTVGITGVNADGTVVIPTKWADLGAVADSAYGDYPAPGEPVPPIWAQLLAMIGTLANLNTEARENLVAAINEVLTKAGTGGGNVDLTGYATEQFVREGFQPKGNYLTEVPEGYARTEDVPTKPEDIGALPSTYIPPDQTAQQVGADPKGTAAAAVSQHNTAEDSHGDIRLELKALSDRLTAFFDSDDATLDELSEIVACITGNKSLIESITTSKVSVADIVNNLTTNVSNKPLSAAQGVVLKGLIDALSTGKLDASALQSAINDALAQAKANGEFDGEPGKDGADGYTPVKGKDYFDGKDGADGKSAYAYAQEGGYTGTEAEFAEKMAEELPTKVSELDNDSDYAPRSELPKLFEVTITDNGDGTYTSSHYYADIKAAYDSGRMPIAVLNSERFPLVYMSIPLAASARFSKVSGAECHIINVTKLNVDYSITKLATHGDIPNISQEPFYVISAQEYNEDGTIDILGCLNGETGVTENIASELRTATLQGRAVFLRLVPEGLLLPFASFFEETEFFVFHLPLGSESYTAIVTEGVAQILPWQFPEELPNPNTLTINGVSYDGSEAKDITDTIDAMIDAKLAEMPVWTGGAY